MANKKSNYYKKSTYNKSYQYKGYKRKNDNKYKKYDSKKENLDKEKSFENTSQILFDFNDNKIKDDNDDILFDSNDISKIDEKEDTIELLEEIDEESTVEELAFEKPVTKTRKVKENLDVTTRIRIDYDRLNDSDSLDTSFLDGKISKKKVNKIIDKSIPKENSNKVNEVTKYKSKEKKNIKGILIAILIIVVILGFIFFCVFSVSSLINNKKNDEKPVKVVETIVDENILFLGDSITEMYHLDDYYEDYHVVNSGVGGNTTQDILDDMEGRVYRYNPSKVFLLIGTNDMCLDKYKDDIPEHIQEIISLIKKNRKYAKIYIESIYPINNTDDDKINHKHVSDRTNEHIKELNKEIKKIAKEEGITYINMYDILVDEDNQLNIDYTDEGLHISEKGYDVITNELLKYIKDEK